MTMGEMISERHAQLRHELEKCRQQLRELGALEQRLLGALIVLDELAIPRQNDADTEYKPLQEDEA